MSTELFYGIVAAFIVVLVWVVGWFINNMIDKNNKQMEKVGDKIDAVDSNVTKLLTAHGISDEKLKSFEEQIRIISEEQREHSRNWTILYKDHNMHSIRNK